MKIYSITWAAINYSAQIKQSIYMKSISRTRFTLSFCVLFAAFYISGCTAGKQIGQSVLSAPSLQTAHIGISIYDAGSQKYLYNYQGDKYFIPASNIKIPTCYAAMKYLGDSLVAFLFAENDTAIYIQPTGDPTLLLSEFKKQPGIEFLQKTQKRVFINNNSWQERPWGSGWAWNDYDESYMAERSSFPVYGNVLKWTQSQTVDGETGDKGVSVYSDPFVFWEVNFDTDTSNNAFSVSRKIDSNVFTIYQGKEKLKEISVPFVANGVKSALEILIDTIGRPINEIDQFPSFNKPYTAVHSQPLDSLLAPMMHRSDNFFAEQSLLMVSNARLGIMNDAKIIDTLLKTDFKALPQKPRWVDGSGLSRYNLFTPQDMVAILNLMQQEFGMKRIKIIFPTGGEGTISSYYKADSGYIYAKTGTLSGVVALSGFIETKKGRNLIFSVLVNNHQSSATEVRRAVEKFLQEVRSKY